MAINIQLRRGTASEWTTANPTLAVAEFGIETDTALFKIGNGSDNWTTLGYGGLSGVVAATAPITYDSGTKTVGITQSAIAINMSQVATTVNDKTANYTLLASDQNTYIRSTGSAITITVPDVLANGESVNFIQDGAGQITFAGSGVAINSVDAKLKTNKQFSGATITKVGGAYYLIGDLAS